MHACMALNRACSCTPASGACSRTIHMCVYTCVCVCVYIYIYGYRSSDLLTYKLHTVHIHAYRISTHVRTHTRTLKLCVPCSRTTPLTHARTRTSSAWAALAPACSTARRRDASPRRAQSSKSAFLFSSVMSGVLAPAARRHSNVAVSFASSSAVFPSCAYHVCTYMCIHLCMYVSVFVT